MDGAFLAETRVVEFTATLAGPYATTILADLGAEVVNVEGISGDSMRRRQRAADEGLSLPFAMIHRNKGSVAVDLKDPRGTEVARRLVAMADAVVENFPPGVTDGLGLGYDAVRAINLSVVYCSISGFGQNGPLSHLGGVDLIAQGFGGLMSVTGFSPLEPAKAGFPVSDVGTGMWAAIGVLGALARRRATGAGAHVGISLAECVASWALWEVADWQTRGEVPAPLGTAHRLTAPYQAFCCKDDRFVNVAATVDRWRAFCEAVGLPELVGDPRFATEVARFANRAKLSALLQRRFASRPRDEWIGVLRAVKVPCGPINTIPEVLDDTHLRSRQLFGRVTSGADEWTVVRTPIVSTGAPRAVRQPPELGEDTRTVLGHLGFTDDAIDRLAGEGVIACAPRVRRGATR